MKSVFFSLRLLVFALKNHMLVFLNGQFVPEARAVVPVNDRGFLYGDGLFETIACREGQACWLALHLQRLQQGCERLRLAFDGFELLRAEKLDRMPKYLADQVKRGATS